MDVRDADGESNSVTHIGWKGYIIVFIVLPQTFKNCHKPCQAKKTPSYQLSAWRAKSVSFTTQYQTSAVAQ